MKFFDSLGNAFCCSALFVFLAAGVAHAQFTPYPDNEARNAILKERQRIDAIRADFDKLRGEAQVFRTEGEATRRESEILRRDVNAVQANLGLMFRKVDAKIDDDLKPVSESVQRGVDELLVLQRANVYLQSQIEQSRAEVRDLRGKTEELETQIRDLRRKMESR